MVTSSIALPRTDRRAIDGAPSDDAVVGEEGTATDGTSGVHWLIDPIDGTTNFLYDLPDTPSRSRPRRRGRARGSRVRSRARRVVRPRAAMAVRPRRAAIRCGDLADLRSALVATGFSYLPDRRAVQAERVARLIPTCVTSPARGRIGRSVLRGDGPPRRLLEETSARGTSPRRADRS